MVAKDQMSTAETDLLRAIMLAHGCGNTRLFRNNCGAWRDLEGRWVKYGVARPGGSDLIGWHSVCITPQMVGRLMALFTAIEIKTVDGRTSPKRLKAQRQFIAAVNDAGGLAGMVRSVEEAGAILGERCSDGQEG